MGRVTGSYGLHGWLRVKPFDADPDTLAKQGSWWLRARGGKQWTRYAVEGSKLHSGQLLAKLEAVSSREMALALRGSDVGLPREALPEPEAGSFYWSDLIGLEVVNRGGERLGAVKSMFSNGAQDVMEVAGERTRLVPWVNAVVVRVDMAARRIEVDWGADW